MRDGIGAVAIGPPLIHHHECITPRTQVQVSLVSREIETGGEGRNTHDGRRYDEVSRVVGGWRIPFFRRARPHVSTTGRRHTYRGVFCYASARKMQRLVVGRSGTPQELEGCCFVLHSSTVARSQGQSAAVAQKLRDNGTRDLLT